MNKVAKAGIIAGVIAMVGFVGVGVATRLGEKVRKMGGFDKFELSSEVYNAGEFHEISAEKFGQMMERKKSFIVVMHMTVCPAEFPITEVAKKFAREDGMMIYGLKEDEYKKTILADEVKYLPSAAIIHEGEVVDFLDAEDDGDVKFYQSVGGFREWVEGYVL